MENVQHQPQKNRFIIQQGDEEAILKYVIKNGSPAITIDFTSTFVPPDLRGRGLAEKLVYSGLSWARDQGYDIQASCWYVAKFLR